MKTVAEFEEKLFSRPQTSQAGENVFQTPEQLNASELPDSESGLLARKFDFENAISKCQADLSFN